MLKHHLLSFYISHSLLLPSCLPFPFFLPLDQNKCLFQHFNHSCQTLKFVSPFLLSLHSSSKSNTLSLASTFSTGENSWWGRAVSPYIQRPTLSRAPKLHEPKALSYSLRSYFKPLLSTPPLLTGWKFLAFLVLHQQDLSIRLFIDSKDSMFFIYIWG